MGCEFMGLIRGQYEAKQDGGFLPGGAVLNPKKLGWTLITWLSVLPSPQSAIAVSCQKAAARSLVTDGSPAACTLLVCFRVGPTRPQASVITAPSPHSVASPQAPACTCA